MKKGFTLIELIIVIVIIAIIVGFAVPGYQSAMNKAKEREGILQMEALIGGQKIYKAKYDRYWYVRDDTNGGTSTGSLTLINQILGTNVQNTHGFVYNASNYAGSHEAYMDVWVVTPNGLYMLFWDEIDDAICCKSNNCPTVPNC